jgi:dTDP-4-amino-4,6-dideoxygalactose transaminase
MNAMVAGGVATRRIMAIHMEPVYRGLYPGVSLPITERVARESIQLPIFPALTAAEQDVVVEELKRALD